MVHFNNTLPNPIIREAQAAVVNGTDVLAGPTPTCSRRNDTDRTGIISARKESSRRRNCGLISLSATHRSTGPDSPRN